MNNYLQDILASLKPWILRDWIEKVVIVIWAHEKVPFERYTVDLSGVIKLGATLLNEKQIQLCELEQTFRVFLLKINSSVTFLAPISPEYGVTFSVAAEVKDPTEPSRQQEINKSKKWIPWLLNLNNSTKSELIPKSKKTRLSSFPPSESLLIDLCVEENCQREELLQNIIESRSNRSEEKSEDSEEVEEEDENQEME